MTKIDVSLKGGPVFVTPGLPGRDDRVVRALGLSTRHPLVAGGSGYGLVADWAPAGVAWDDMDLFYVQQRTPNRYRYWTHSETGHEYPLRVQPTLVRWKSAYNVDGSPRKVFVTDHGPHDYSELVNSRIPYVHAELLTRPGLHLKASNAICWDCAVESANELDRIDFAGVHASGGPILFSLVLPVWDLLRISARAAWATARWSANLASWPFRNLMQGDEVQDAYEDPLDGWDDDTPMPDQQEQFEVALQEQEYANPADPLLPSLRTDDPTKDGALVQMTEALAMQSAEHWRDWPQRFDAAETSPIGEALEATDIPVAAS